MNCSAALNRHAISEKHNAVMHLLAISAWLLLHYGILAKVWMSQYASASTEMCCSGIYCNKCKWLNSFLSSLSGRIQFILTAREPFSMHAHPQQISLQNRMHLLLWNFPRCKWLFTLLKVHLWPLHNPLKSYKIVRDFFDRSQANICLRYDRSWFDWAINM